MIEKTSSFMERLNEAISVKGISAAEISKRTGISDGQFQILKKIFKKVLTFKKWKCYNTTCRANRK